MAAYNGKKGGRIIIGGNTIPGTYLMLQLIAGFKRLYPDAVVSLIIGDTAHIVKGILDGGLELGIVGHEPKSSILSKRNSYPTRCASSYRQVIVGLVISAISI